MREAHPDFREMTQATAHASRNARLPRYTIELAVPVAVSAFLSLTDAFGLDLLPLSARFLYWLVLLAAGQAESLLIRRLLDRLQLSRPRLVIAGILVTTLGVLPMAVLVWFVTGFALSKPHNPTQLSYFYLAVLVVAAAMISINVLAQRRPVMTQADPSAVANAHQQPHSGAAVRGVHGKRLGTTGLDRNRANRAGATHPAWHRDSTQQHHPSTS
jgi:hypothetical protein